MGPIFINELMGVEVEDTQIFHFLRCVVCVLHEATHEIEVIEKDGSGDAEEILWSFSICDLGGC